MANAKIQTVQNGGSVGKFLESVKDEQRKNDAQTVVKLMQEITGQEPKMWGPAIIGFGNYHYKYESGREGDMPKVALSPRKLNLTLYGLVGVDEELMKSIGKATTSVACLYIKKLSDIDMNVLKKLIEKAYKKWI